MKDLISVYDLRMVKDREVEYDAKENRVAQPQIIADIFEEAFHLSELAEEVMVMACLNTKNEVVGLFKVSQGSLNASIAHPREIYKRAIIANANSIILGHNHPSGHLEPSYEDISVTERLMEVGDLLGIKLLDHIIMADFDFVSLKEESYI